jgi:hypothetical protein
MIDHSTYKMPPPIMRPFQRGEMVNVRDSQLEVIGVQKVVRAGKRVVRTDCGRSWEATSGWWIGEFQAWPFPSIGHQGRPRAKREGKGRKARGGRR